MLRVLLYLNRIVYNQIYGKVVQEISYSYWFVMKVDLISNCTDCMAYSISVLQRCGCSPEDFPEDLEDHVSYPSTALQAARACSSPGRHVAKTLCDIKQTP